MKVATMIIEGKRYAKAAQTAMYCGLARYSNDVDRKKMYLYKAYTNAEMLKRML